MVLSSDDDQIGGEVVVDVFSVQSILQGKLLRVCHNADVGHSALVLIMLYASIGRRVGSPNAEQPPYYPDESTQVLAHNQAAQQSYDSAYPQASESPQHCS